MNDELLTTSLKISDAHHLLRPIAHRWRILGRIIGLHVDDLQYSPRSLEDKLLSVCQRWQRSFPATFTVAGLLDLIEAPVINNHLLHRCISECIVEAHDSNCTIMSIKHSYYDYF